MGNYIGTYPDKEAIDAQVEARTDTIPYAFIDDETDKIYYNTTDETAVVPNYYNMFVAIVNGQDSTGIVIPQGVTQIKNYCFRQTNITEVEIPDSVTSIGIQAFYNCPNLTELYIPNSVTYIYDGTSTANNSHVCAACTSLTTVHWPENSSITYFPYYAFYNDTALTTINLPTTVTWVGNYAFANCANLSVDVSDFISQLATIGSYAFSGCANITGDIVTGTCATINAYAFNGCAKITSFTGPNVVTIGNNAFKGCSLLSEVHLTDKVTAAGFYNSNNANRAYIFQNCTSLQSIEFGTSESPNTLVNGFAGYTFAGCSSLEWDNIRFPTAITAFQMYCFQGCTSLGTNITIPSTVTTLGPDCFRGCTSLEYVDASHVTTFNIRCFYGCSSLQTVTLASNSVFTNTCFQSSGIRYITIPATVTAANFYNSNNNNRKNIFNGCTNLHTISFEGNTLINGFADQTFINCTSLRWKNITFPTSVTVFQVACFRGCTSLGPVVDVPSGITTLGNGCFYGDTNIKLMVLPTTLTTMNGANNNGCFYNCTNMFTVIMKRTTPTNPNAYAFQGAGGTNARLYVPASAL